MPDGACVVARVPVYGTRDAGRGFWLKLENVISDVGLVQNSVMPAFFSYAVDGVIKVLLCTHVDDIIWANDPDCDWMIDKILSVFDVGKVEERNFRYCGCEISQSEDFTINVTCIDNTEKIEPIKYAPGRKLTEPCSDQEKSQLLSVVGSLAWIARMCRPDLSYRVSRLQSRSKKALVRELKEANIVLDYALQDSKTGLRFTPQLDWDNAVLTTVSDASFAQEQDIVGDETVHDRSQKGFLQVLANSSVIDGDGGVFSPLAFGSTVIKRVCRATLQAETYGLSGAQERGFRLRAVIAGARGVLDMKNWESTSCKSMRHLWITDCKSLEEHLVKESMSKIDDKRLSIELSALRQLIWERDGVKTESIDKTSGDMVRWIDTSVMLADPLTKAMKADALLTALSTNFMTFIATAESVLRKVKRSK